MKAIGYVRVSTLSQVDGEGLGVQVDRIKGWCQYQQIELAELHEDAGLSGANMSRPGLQEALRRAVELGKDGVLVVARLDRVGRNAIEVQVVLRDLLNAGVRVVAIGDSIDTSSGMGRSILKLLVSILASFAEMERELIRDRLLQGRLRARRERRVYAVEPRLGLKVGEDGNLVDVAEELVALARAKELRAERRSYRAIARTLDDEGHRPRRAARWQAAVVRRMLMRADPDAA